MFAVMITTAVFGKVDRKIEKVLGKKRKEIFNTFYIFIIKKLKKSRWGPKPKFHQISTLLKM